jgi:MoaA/NifB/PqqE/SkfB family radical SAM enzyme
MTDDPVRTLQLVSPSFCPLRWSYLQIDLQHGRIKACCKTPFQALTGDELADRGSDAIFNNDYVLARRAEMLAGVKHPDCAACWRAEDLGVQSYRRSQAAKPMFREVTDNVAATRRLDGAVPRHIEIIMRTTCDLACAYCGPDFSVRWEKEIDRHGRYPEDGGLPVMPTVGAPPNLADTFRAWLSGHLGEVRYLQFNGGEPLIQDEFYEFLELVLADRSANRLRLGVITNLNTPPARLRRLLELLPHLHERHDFRFGVSLDAVGRRAEYIRYGLRWDRFDHNLRMLLTTVPDLDLQLAPTMSALNVSSCPDLVDYAAEIQSKYHARITFRPSMVMWPDFQSPLILRPEDYQPISRAVASISARQLWPNLRERLVEIQHAAQRAPDVDRLRAAFHRWFTEYDRRRGLDLPTVFPELADFWRECAAAAEQQGSEG